MKQNPFKIGLRSRSYFLPNLVACIPPQLIEAFASSEVFGGADLLEALKWLQELLLAYQAPCNYIDMIWVYHIFVTYTIYHMLRMCIYTPIYTVVM